MLDTIKLGIPLTQSQHIKVKGLADKNDCWQWILHNPTTGELLFRRTKGLATTDGQSFHRQLRWDIPHDYSPTDCKLTLEFSVPKYWYGQNIHLLYDFVEPIKQLKAALDRQFGFKGKGRLPDVMTWQVLRLDLCYAWRFPSQRLAQSFLDSLKHLHFPRKRPIYYPTAILFAGKTYSVKFYLKLPEFRNHDRKEMLKANASLEWVNHCESIADGILRFEATLRQKYLKRHNIQTLANLIKPVEYVEWIEGTPPNHELLRIVVISKVLGDHFAKQISSDLHKKFELSLGEFPGEKPFIVTPQQVLHIPFAGFTIERGSHYDLLVKQLPDELQTAIIEPGCIYYRKTDKATTIAQFLLTKFIGENAGMQKVDEIKSKLMEAYKPVKAARLVSFWLYVQRFGSSEAKEVFGHNSYYVSKRSLKQAGIGLIEPPSGKNITILDRDFMQQFRLEIPSEYVTNKVDDFRDHGNVLNFVPKMSGYDEQA